MLKLWAFSSSFSHRSLVRADDLDPLKSASLPVLFRRAGKKNLKHPLRKTLISKFSPLLPNREEVFGNNDV